MSMSRGDKIWAINFGISYTLRDDMNGVFVTADIGDCADNNMTTDIGLWKKGKGLRRYEGIKMDKETEEIITKNCAFIYETTYPKGRSV